MIRIAQRVARAVVMLAALAMIAPPAVAQFDQLNWTFVPSTSGSGSLSTGEMAIVGPIGACVPGGKFVAYTAVAPFDGTVVVSAEYHAGDESFDSTNFNFVVGAVTTLVSQSYSWTGQLVFDVPAGVVFGFKVGAHCSIGSGHATLTDFSFIPDAGPLPTLDGAPGEHFGSALAPAGDFDGDGAPDLIVGVPDGAPGGIAAGRVAVVSGDLRTTLLALAGAKVGDDFGFAVAGGQDLNGDGVPDLVVGVPKADAIAPLRTDAGRIELRSGVDGSVLHALEGAKAFDKLGFAVAFVGDLDGDGIADVAAGAPFHDEIASNAGQVFLISGATGAVLFDILGQAAGDRLGSALAGAGDIDGDGALDIVVGAPGVTGPSSEAGRVTVHSGLDGSLLLAFEHSTETVSFGTAVAGGGDVNGDGVPDVVGAAPIYNGDVYVHSGADGSLLHLFTGSLPDDLLGSSVSFAGDVDGDGADDLIIGAAQEWIGERGYVQVRSGKTGAVLFVMPGDEPFAHFGSTVALIGDVDGDGRPDIAAGAPSSEQAGTDAGRVRTFEPYLPWTAEGPGLGGAFGVPQLSGKGLVGTGAPNALTLQGAAPHTTAVLVAGLSKALLPFKGGVLVPAADALVLGLVVSNEGTLALPFTWPAGLPPGFDLWLQLWIADPTAPQGLSATNGLHAAGP
ncbi:MAG TPA: integrin alpha [Planctomycetota bacterium]|nr:integrin alpha [Planctomycetota bacterium]